MNPFKRRRQATIARKVEEARAEMNGSGGVPENKELLYLMFAEQRTTNGRLMWILGAFTILGGLMVAHVLGA